MPENTHASVIPGEVIAGRYEILQLLGEGRLGTVYKARDGELARAVALKVIHPELADRPEIFQRFKDQLIQARQLTHKNIIRIFDLHEAGWMKFISMEYVDGENLRQILRAEAKLDRSAALAIIGQVCLALDAAHAEGVIHGDLKPENILVGKQGRVWVTDFGVAASVQSESIPESGPDARTDVYALGAILYELLTGTAPYPGEHVKPAVRVDASIPESLSDLVMHCLAPGRDEACPKPMALFDELEALQGHAATAEQATPSIPRSLGQVEPGRRRPYWKWFVTSALVVAIGAGAVFFRERLVRQPASRQKAMTVLVADFTNTTGESVFDGTLESALTIAMEGASFITAYNRGRARQLGAQLKPGTSKLDDELARLVAVRSAMEPPPSALPRPM